MPLEQEMGTGSNGAGIAAASPAFTIEDVPALVNDKQWQDSSPDVRLPALEAVLNGAFEDASRNGMTPEDHAAFLEMADTARKKAAADWGEWAWGKVKGAGSAVADIGKGAGALLYEVNPVRMGYDAVSGHPERLVESAKTLAGAAGNALAGRAANYRQFVESLGPEGRALNAGVDDLFQRIDKGEVQPDAVHGEADRLRPLLEQYHSSGLTRMDWSPDLYSMIVPNAAQKAAPENDLTQPENVALLASYMATRNPQAKAQLKANLFRTGMNAAVAQDRESILNSPGAKHFEETFGKGSAQHLVSGADPVNVLMLALPFMRGLGLAEGATTALGKAAEFAGTQTAFGVDAAIQKNPSDPNYAEGITDMAALGVLMHGAGATVKRLLPGERPAGGVEAPTAATDTLDAQFAQAMGEVAAPQAEVAAPQAEGSAPPAPTKPITETPVAAEPPSARPPVIPDSPLGDYDILDYLNEHPINIPRKGTTGTAGEYDWRETADLPRYYRKFIVRAGEGGEAIDVTAQNAYEKGFIREPSVDALIEEVHSVIRKRTQHRVEIRRQEKSLREQEAQQLAYEQAEQSADKKIPLDRVAKGDKFDLGTEKDVTVKDVSYDEDGHMESVTIEDGRKFGVLTFDAQSRGALLVDEWKPRARTVHEGEEFNAFSKKDPLDEGGKTGATSGHERALGEPELGRIRAAIATRVPADYPVESIRALRGDELRTVEGRGGGGDLEAARVLAAAFGRRIEVLTADAPLPFNGWVNGQFRDIIFLDRESTRPFFITAGHELWHHMEMDQPALARELKSKLGKDMLQLDIAKRYYSKYDPAEVPNELMADLLGESFTKPEFWEKLKQRDADLFTRTATAVLNWLRGTIEKVRRFFRPTDPHFRSLERAQAMLADALAQWAKEGATPSQRTRIQNYFSGWRETMDAITGNAKEIARRFVDFPLFNDLKRTVNEWVGRMQASSISIRNMMSEIEKRVPDAKRREAITNWIQAAGDDATLAAREVQSTDPTRKSGYRAARNLTPEEQALAAKIRTYYDAALAKAQSYGLVEDGLENYVNQVWKRPILPGKTQALDGFMGQLARNFKFGNKRSFESFFEGEQAGFEPVTKDISKLLGLYLNELNKVIATREMIARLTKGNASDGRPLAVPEGGALPHNSADPATTTLVLPGAKGTVKFQGADHDTRDYRTTESPALAKWKFASADTAGEPVMVLGRLALHPEAYELIKPALSESVIRKWARSKADSIPGHLLRLGVRGLDALQSQVKASMMSLSPFHIVQEGTHAIGHKVNPFTDIPTIDPTNRTHVDAMNHGLMLAGDRVAMSQFMDGFTPKGSWLEKIPGIGKWQKSVSEFTFEHYIPGLKFKTYEHILARNRLRYQQELNAGKLKDADVKYLSAKQTNAAYGHLNYKDMGRDPTFQHLLRLTLLAPDFLEARAKFTGQAIQGIGQKLGREQLMAMATLAVTFYVGARVINAALNNGDTKNDLDHLFAVESGNRIYSMRSVPEDIYRLFHSPRQFVAGRVAPLIGTGALEGIFGVNYRGEKVSGGEVVQDTLTNAIPMSVRMVPGVSDLTRTQKNHPVTAWEQFMGAMGLQIGRHSPIIETQKQAHAFMEAMGVENRGSYPVSQYQQLRYALEDLNWDKAKEEVKKLLGPTGRRKDLRDRFKTSLFHSWTKSDKMDKQWKETLKPEQKGLLEEAEERRKAVWQRFIKILDAPD